MDTRAFRQACGKFATGITIVTAIGQDNAPFGVTANSFSSVSLEPPLVLFCLGRDATNFSDLRNTDCFAVNVLASDQEQLSNRFARLDGSEEDSFTGVSYETWDTGCPILSGCLANFECRIENVHDAGDHVILVGRVQRFKEDPDLKPILYFSGKYREVAD